MKRTLLITIFITITTLIFATTHQILNDQDFTDELRKHAPGAEFTSHIIDNYRYALITYSDTTRYFIISSDYSQVKGFNGTTTLAIVLNPDLSVYNVNIIKSQDTPAYVKMLTSKGFLKLFQGFRRDDNVVHITRATITCQAIIQTVNECIERFTHIIEK